MDRESKSKSQIIVKICCVLAALSLWLYITYVENPIKTYKVKNIPVQLINEEAINEAKLALLPDQKFTISVNIKVTSSDLYLAKADQFKIIADMSAYVLKKGENRIPIQIAESPSEVVIENSEKLWITVILDDYLEKSVMVTTAIEGEAKNGYSTLDPVISPNSVIVSGAAAYVNQVSYVEAKGNIKNIDKNTILTLPIQAKNSFGNVIKEVSAEPSVVEVLLPIKKKKSVPVFFKSKGELKEGLEVASVNIDPSSIEIIGDEKDLEKINSINIKPIDISKINANTIKEAELDLPENISTFSGLNKVSVDIKVEKIEEKNVSLDVEIINESASFNVELEKQQVSLIISGAQSKIDKLKLEEIKATVDVGMLKEGTHNVPIDISLPDGINKVSLTPKEVKIIITKKATANENPEVNNVN